MMPLKPLSNWSTCTVLPLDNHHTANCLISIQTEHGNTIICSIHPSLPYSHAIWYHSFCPHHNNPVKPVLLWHYCIQQYHAQLLHAPCQQPADLPYQYSCMTPTPSCKEHPIEDMTWPLSTNLIKILHHSSFLNLPNTNHTVPVPYPRYLHPFHLQPTNYPSASIMGDPMWHQHAISIDQMSDFTRPGTWPTMASPTSK